MSSGIWGGDFPKNMCLLLYFTSSIASFLVHGSQKQQGTLQTQLLACQKHLLVLPEPLTLSTGSGALASIRVGWEQETSCPICSPLDWPLCRSARTQRHQLPQSPPTPPNARAPAAPECNHPCRDTRWRQLPQAYPPCSSPYRHRGRARGSPGWRRRAAHSQVYQDQ
jgi:hypothetical protein